MINKDKIRRKELSPVFWRAEKEGGLFKKYAYGEKKGLYINEVEKMNREKG